MVTRAANLTRGATMMVVFIMLAKVLGLLFTIPLTPLIGNRGLGIYANAYSLYVLLLTLSTTGFPTAMGRLISERLALKRYGDVEQIYRVTIRLVGVLGVVMFLLMWFGAPLYSRMVAVQSQAAAVQAYTLSIRALAPSLLVVPLMSALRGYLQGFQRMEPSAYSQAIEQLFRVIAIIIGAWWVMRATHDVSRGAAAATFGSFVGALAGVILLGIAVAGLRKETLHDKDAEPTESARTALRVLWRYALPVCLGSIVVPISQNVDTLMVHNLLEASGYTFKEADAAWGILSRQAFQLVNIPLAFALAIGATVLPAIAHSQTLKDQAGVIQKIRGTIRSMFFMTFPAAAVFLVLSRTIDMAFYRGYQGTGVIAMVAAIGIFSGLELISTYMLQGLGKMYRPVRNMFVGIIVKVIFNAILIHSLGILGAAIASAIGYLCSSWLNIMAVKKYGRIHFSVWRLLGPSLFSAIVLCVVLWIANRVVSWVIPLSGSVGMRQFESWIQLFIILAIGGVAYLVVSIRSRAVTAAELRGLPAVGGMLARFAARIRPEAVQESARRI
jgi:O-antigen/teichoic acid export membrane protein